MKLYLDSADIDAWAALMPTGLFHGITTNPALLARVGLDQQTIDWSAMAGRAAALDAAELHVQMTGAQERYLDRAGALYDLGKAEGIELVLKIPLVRKAIRHVPEIRALGGRVLLTACFDAKQMFVATALGADFIAPYFGRMADAGMDAFSHLARMRAIRDAAGKRCEIIVASVRSTDQMTLLAAQGQTAFTISPAIAQSLLDDPKSAAAYEAFEAMMTGEARP